MINWVVNRALLSKQPADVLERLAHADASGNEAYRFLIDHCVELAGNIRKTTENLNRPVTDVELRQARGALHVLGMIADLPMAAHLLQQQRIEKSKTEKQPEGKP